MPVMCQAEDELGAEPRHVCYSDLAGIEGVLQDVRELIERPLKHPEVRPCLPLDACLYPG